MSRDSNIPLADDRFAFGLTTSDVIELQSILREDCREDLSLEEAWSRAAGLLALTQAVLAPDELAGSRKDAAGLEHRPT